MSHTMDLEIEFGVPLEVIINNIEGITGENFIEKDSTLHASLKNGLDIYVKSFSHPMPIRAEDYEQYWSVGIHVAFRYNNDTYQESTAFIKNFLKNLAKISEKHFILSYEFEKVYLEGFMHEILYLTSL